MRGCFVADAVMPDHLMAMVWRAVEEAQKWRGF